MNAAGPVTDEATYAGAVGKVFGAAARDAILARYPAGSYEAPRRAFVQLTTDAFFTCVSRRVASALAAARRSRCTATTSRTSWRTTRRRAPMARSTRSSIPISSHGGESTVRARRISRSRMLSSATGRAWRRSETRTATAPRTGRRSRRTGTPTWRSGSVSPPATVRTPLSAISGTRSRFPGLISDGARPKGAQHSRGVAAEPVGRARYSFPRGLFPVPRVEGISPQKVDETMVALRELGLKGAFESGWASSIYAPTAGFPKQISLT